MENSLTEPEEVDENATDNEEDDNETNESGSNEHDFNEEDYIKSLFVKEVPRDEFQVKIEEYSLKSGGNWIEVARKAGIQYIQKKRYILGFNPQTTYLAVMYFTRFFTRFFSTTKFEMKEDEHSWVIRLMSVACLSLSAKMEEVAVPALSNFCMNDYTFNNRDIKKMELCVLNALKWEMGLITPFAFTGFFAEKLFELFSLEAVSSKVEHAILSSVRDLKTMCYRPSVVALAATLVTIDHGLTATNTLRLKIEPLVSEIAMNIYDVIICYILVQRTVESQITGHSGRRILSITSIASARGKTHKPNYSLRK